MSRRYLTHLWTSLIVSLFEFYPPFPLKTIMQIYLDVKDAKTFNLTHHSGSFVLKLRLDWPSSNDSILFIGQWKSNLLLQLYKLSFLLIKNYVEILLFTELLCGLQILANFIDASSSVPIKNPNCEFHFILSFSSTSQRTLRGTSLPFVNHVQSQKFFLTCRG